MTKKERYKEKIKKRNEKLRNYRNMLYIEFQISSKYTCQVPIEDIVRVRADNELLRITRKNGERSTYKVGYKYAIILASKIQERIDLWKKPSNKLDLKSARLLFSNKQ